MSLQFEIRDQNDNGDGMSVKSKVNVTEADKNDLTSHKTDRGTPRAHLTEKVGQLS